MVELRTLGGLSVSRDGAPATGAAAQRKTLALLAVLAGAGDKGVSRDKLIALLWPESDGEHGRNLLTQACYALRRDLQAPEFFLGSTELRLNPAVLSCDLQSFDHALARDDLAGATAAYAGAFLDGFFLGDAPEFERWVESERERLAKQCRDALEALATEATQRGDRRTAAGWWRRLTVVDPLSAHAALGLMHALDDAGERAEALEHGRRHEAFVRREFEAEPAAEVAALVKRLRLQTGEKPRSLDPQVGDMPLPASIPRRRPRAARIVVAVTAVLGIGGVLAAIGLRGGDRPLILAVGAIRDYVGTDTGGVAPTVAEMLATNLARVPRLQVLSTARIYGLLRPPPGSGREGAATQAARRAARGGPRPEGRPYR